MPKDITTLRISREYREMLRDIERAQGVTAQDYVQSVIERDWPKAVVANLRTARERAAAAEKLTAQAVAE